MKLPKGASDKVKQMAGEIAKKHGGAAFLEVAKCHFKTTDEVLASEGRSRAELGPLGQHVSQSARKEQAP